MRLVSETSNTIAALEVSIEPLTYAHVRVINQVQDSTAANIEVAIDFVGVVEHNCARTANNISVDICTGGVKASDGKVHVKKG